MLSFLEFIESSTRAESFFASRLGALSPREYERIVALLDKENYLDQVSHLECSPKRASRALLSLSALASQYYEDSLDAWVNRPEVLSELKRLLEWL